jgi:nitrate reductase gamma subunit
LTGPARGYHTGMTTATTPDQTSAIVDKAALIAYKPIGMVFGVLGGLLANLAFGQVWKRISDAPTPPNATDEDYTTREVLLAAVIQGALFGLIKSAVDRAGMRAVKRVVNGPARR